MNKTVAAIIMGVVLTTSALAANSAYASSWDQDPHETLHKEQANPSHSFSYVKNSVVKQKAYGWSHSKVCGLELCKNAKNDTPSSSLLLEKNMSSGSFMGKLPSNGKYYIKGDFPEQGFQSKDTSSK